MTSFRNLPAAAAAAASALLALGCPSSLVVAAEVASHSVVQEPAGALFERLAAVAAAAASTPTLEVGEDRVQIFEGAMLPIFRTLPKVSEGRLPVGAVRYMLRRTFAARYHWDVAAFDLAGAAADGGGASPDRGLTLREAAVLAASFEGLAKEETASRLRTAFRSIGLKDHEIVKDRDANLVLQTFSVLFARGLDGSTPAGAILEALREMRSNEQWPVLRAWLRQVRQEVVLSLPPQSDKGSFQALLRVAEEVTFRFGATRKQDCDASPTSACMRVSKYHSVCCPNQCDALLAEVELAVAAPQAKSSALLEVFNKMRAATAEATPSLPPGLASRLDSAGARFGGAVPVHSRAVLESLRDAFPETCSAPVEERLDALAEEALLLAALSPTAAPSMLRSSLLRVSAVIVVAVSMVAAMLQTALGAKSAAASGCRHLDEKKPL